MALADVNRDKTSNPVTSMAEIIHHSDNVPTNIGGASTEEQPLLLTRNRELRKKLSEMEANLTGLMGNIRKRDERIDELQRSLITSKRATSDAEEKALSVEENFATNRRFFENEKKELLKEVEMLTQKTKCLKTIEDAREKKLEPDEALDKFKNTRCANCEETKKKYLSMIKCIRMETEIKAKVKWAHEDGIACMKLETKLDEILARQKRAISVAVQSDGPLMKESSTQCEAPTTVNTRIQCSPMTIEQCTQIRDDLNTLVSISTQWVEPSPKVLVECEAQTETLAAKFTIATQSEPPNAKACSSTQSDAQAPKLSVGTQSYLPISMKMMPAQVQTVYLPEEETAMNAVPDTTLMPRMSKVTKRQNTSERCYISRLKRARSQAPRQSNSAELTTRTTKTDSGFSIVSESVSGITPDAPRPGADEIRHFFDIFDRSALTPTPIAATMTLPESKDNVTEQEEDNRKTATVKRKTSKSVPEILESAYKRRIKKLSQKTGVDAAEVTQWLEMRNGSGHEPVHGRAPEAVDSPEVDPEAQIAQNASLPPNFDDEHPSTSRIPQTELYREGQPRLVSIKAENTPETGVIAEGHNTVEPLLVQDPMPQNVHETAQQPLNAHQSQAIHSDFNHAGQEPYPTTAHVINGGPIPISSGNFTEDPIMQWRHRTSSYLEGVFKNLTRLNPATIKRLSQQANVGEDVVSELWQIHKQGRQKEKTKVERNQKGTEMQQFKPLSPTSFAELCAEVINSDQHHQNSYIQNPCHLQNQNPRLNPSHQIAVMTFPSQSSSSQVITYSGQQNGSGNQTQQCSAQNRQNPILSGQLPTQSLSHAQSQQCHDTIRQMAQFPMSSRVLMKALIQPQNTANFVQMPQARMQLLPWSFNFPQQHLQHNAQQVQQIVLNKENLQWPQIDRPSSANAQTIVGLMNSCVNNIGLAHKKSSSSHLEEKSRQAHATIAPYTMMSSSSKITNQPKQHSLNPCNSLAEKKDKKKELSRKAQAKYRENKRMERESTKSELKALEARNTELRTECTLIESEIKYLNGHIKEIESRKARR
ncbi:cyclic AMP-dependent transcription factor ATF-5 [Ditylenchus destructor]|uniref:Cyclic AMP-dependent transcription factor ATF-5 n=1 Tax=Ditylenchus destructor TaxID=166010 RepID=A0AAD4QSE9_9BILA|nr:cyclic AMP-dependent transcription factor ATF-5 [Ditylenchus destructor]